MYRLIAKTHPTNIQEEIIIFRVMKMEKLCFQLMEEIFSRSARTFFYSRFFCLQQTFIFLVMEFPFPTWLLK